MSYSNRQRSISDKLIWLIDFLSVTFSRKRKLAERKRRRILFWQLLGIALLIVGVFWAVWFIPGSFYSAVSDEQARISAEVATRTALISSLTAIAAFFALFWTARSYRLSVRGQLTENFLKAAENLSATDFSQRLSAIYVLERVALDSKIDHRAVVDILGTFVKNSTSNWDINNPTPVDVQSAISILGRLPRRESIPRADLSGSTLVNVDLSRSDFTEGDFSNATLKNCTVERSHFRGAKFRNSKIYDCSFSDSFLLEAKFTGSHILNCAFSGTILGATFFSGSDIRYSYFGRAKMLNQSDLIGVIDNSEHGNTNIMSAPSIGTLDVNADKPHKE
jgi:uncharacterized protein YjbI with pentapeptide repeats